MLKIAKRPRQFCAALLTLGVLDHDGGRQPAPDVERSRQFHRTRRKCRAKSIDNFVGDRFMKSGGVAKRSQILTQAFQFHAERVRHVFQ